MPKKPPKRPSQPTGPKKPRPGYARPAWLAAFMRLYVAGVLALFAFTACTAAQKAEAQETKAAVIDCSKESVQALANDLGPVVAAAIASAVADWRAALNGLLDAARAMAQGRGEEAVACAVQEVANRYGQQPEARALATSPDDSPRTRAAAYIADQRWTYAYP